MCPAQVLEHGFEIRYVLFPPKGETLSKTCLEEQIRILTVGTEEGKMFLVQGTVSHSTTVSV